MATNIHYKSLENTFHNLDRLIEQAHYHANVSAENWLKQFRRDVILNDPCIGFRDHSLSEQDCNKQIIKNFQDCFRYTIDFLHDLSAEALAKEDYVNQQFQLSAQTNKQLFHELHKRKKITATQQERMLWTNDHIGHLCNACDEQGKHIVSVQLIDSYRIMHEIVSELNAQ